MFDYQAFFASRTDRDFAVATVLRGMADNGYLGRAVEALSRSDASLVSEPVAGTAGVRQIVMNFDGHELTSDYRVDQDTATIYFTNTTFDGRQAHIDDMPMVSYWLPAYFPDGKVADRVADWYKVADQKLEFK
jgi:hypothetical protein